METLETRKVGRAVLCLNRTRGVSRRLGGSPGHTQTGKRRVDNDQTPHGNLEYRTTTAAIADPEEYTVTLCATRSKPGRSLARFTTLEQAQAYFTAMDQAYLP